MFVNLMRARYKKKKTNPLKEEALMSEDAVVTLCAAPMRKSNRLSFNVDLLNEMLHKQHMRTRIA